MTALSHRIFESHCHLDNDFGTSFVQDLRRALNDESAVCYDVLGGLHCGETWWEKIVEELTPRDVFIVVLSPDAMNSCWWAAKSPWQSLSAKISYLCSIVLPTTTKALPLSDLGRKEKRNRPTQEHDNLAILANRETTDDKIGFA